jgi:hypothetical protein
MSRRDKLITYTYRGQIERGPDYHWIDGYSETAEDEGVLYPWMTRRECQQDARAKGAVAQFYTPPGPGAKRFEPEVKP